MYCSVATKVRKVGWLTFVEYIMAFQAGMKNSPRRARKSIRMLVSMKIRFIRISSLYGHTSFSQCQYQQALAQCLSQY